VKFFFHNGTAAVSFFYGEKWTAFAMGKMREEISLVHDREILSFYTTN